MPAQLVVGSEDNRRILETCNNSIEGKINLSVS